VELKPRAVRIHALTLIEATQDDAAFVMECGKGAYVRAVARDLGQMLGCFGHVTALRRTRVGPFVEDDAYTLDEIENQNMAAEALLSVEAGLAELPCVVVDRDTAARLRRGGSVILRGRDAPHEGIVYAACGGVPVAFGEIVQGALAPARVFNLPF
jgi:tRNA pseudouridine55 synthase